MSNCLGHQYWYRCQPSSRYDRYGGQADRGVGPLTDQRAQLALYPQPGPPGSRSPLPRCPRSFVPAAPRLQQSEGVIHAGSRGLPWPPLLALLPPVGDNSRIQRSRSALHSWQPRGLFPMVSVAAHSARLHSNEIHLHLFLCSSKRRPSHQVLTSQ